MIYDLSVEGGVVNRRVPEAGNMQKCFVSLPPNYSTVVWTCSKAHFYILPASGTLFVGTPYWHSDKLGENLGMAAGSFYLFFDFIFQLYLSLFPFFSI